MLLLDLSVMAWPLLSSRSIKVLRSMNRVSIIPHSKWRVIGNPFHLESRSSTSLVFIRRLQMRILRPRVVSNIKKRISFMDSNTTSFETRAPSDTRGEIDLTTTLIDIRAKKILLFTLILHKILLWLLKRHGRLGFSKVFKLLQEPRLVSISSYKRWRIQGEVRWHEFVLILPGSGYLLEDRSSHSINRFRWWRHKFIQRNLVHPSYLNLFFQAPQSIRIGSMDWALLFWGLLQKRALQRRLLEFTSKILWLNFRIFNYSRCLRLLNKIGIGIALKLLSGILIEILLLITLHWHLIHLPRQIGLKPRFLVEKQSYSYLVFEWILTINRLCWDILMITIQSANIRAKVTYLNC